LSPIFATAHYSRKISWLFNIEPSTDRHSRDTLPLRTVILSSSHSPTSRSGGASRSSPFEVFVRGWAEAQTTVGEVDSIGTMKLDLYMKTVLTVIAASLLILCVEHMVLTRVVLAQAGPQKVMIVGSDSVPLKVTDGNLGIDVARSTLLQALGAIEVRPSFDPKTGRATAVFPVVVMNK
jgi:hypothetical protein